MSRSLLLLLAFILPSVLFAQNGDTEIYAIGFKIVSVEKKGNVVHAGIDYGLGAGIKLSQEVRPYGTQRQDVASHNIRLGTAKLTEVTQQKAFADITLYEGQSVFVGDVLYAYMSLPKKQNRSAYFWLVMDAIYITDDSGKPYYRYAEIMERDGASLRTEKFKAMERDMRAEGARLKATGDKAHVQAGPNEGKLVSDVLAVTDTMAVWYYVYYLDQMRVEYRGKTIRLNEGYRGYVEEGDAISADLLKSLFTNATEKQFDEKYRQYKRKITKELLDSWKEEAVKLGADGSYDKAVKLVDLCIALAIRNKSTYDAGAYLFIKGTLLDAQKKYAESAAVYEEALNYFLEAKNQAAEAFAYHSAGEAYFNVNAIEKAHDYISKAVDLRTKLYVDNPTESNYNSLYKSADFAATVAFALKDYKATLDFYQAALLLSQKHKNKRNEGSMLWNIAYTYENSFKEHNKAIEGYEKAFAIHLDLRDTVNALELKRNLTICYKVLNDYPNAESQLQQGIALARSWGKPIAVAYLLEYGGLMFFEHSEFQKSVKYYSEAEQIYRKMNDPVKLEGTLKKLANSMRDANMNAEAIVKFKERLSLVPKENKSEKASACWDLAFTYSRVKDRKNEVAYYKQAESIYVELKDSANLSTLLNNLGFTYRDSGDSVMSYKYHQHAIA